MTSRGLRGPNIHVHHVNETERVIAYHRWQNGGPRDDVIVLANFSATPRTSTDRRAAGRTLAGPLQLRLGRLRPGVRDGRVDRCRCDPERRDGMRYSLTVGLGPYSAVILSQDD